MVGGLFLEAVSYTELCMKYINLPDQINSTLKSLYELFKNISQQLIILLSISITPH